MFANNENCNETPLLPGKSIQGESSAGGLSTQRIKPFGKSALSDLKNTYSETPNKFGKRKDILDLKKFLTPLHTSTTKNATNKGELAGCSSRQLLSPINVNVSTPIVQKKAAPKMVQTKPKPDLHDEFAYRLHFSDEDINRLIYGPYAEYDDEEIPPPLMEMLTISPYEAPTLEDDILEFPFLPLDGPPMEIEKPTRTYVDDSFEFPDLPDYL